MAHSLLSTRSGARSPILRSARLAAVAIAVMSCTSRAPAPTGSPGAAEPSSASTAPDVVGRNFLEALVDVSPGLRLVDKTYCLSSRVRNGTIVSQRPPGGSEIGPGTAAIFVVVSVHPSEVRATATGYQRCQDRP